MQRHKNPSPENHNEDFISRLPDELLVQILSLLPESDANRTRILSKRWKNVYAFLPNLRFVLQFPWPMAQVRSFYHFINQTFAIRNNIPIQRFFLDSSQNCEFTSLYRCLSTLVQLQVRQLYIRLPEDMFWGSIHRELFKTCTTLVELSLTGWFRLDVPKQADLIFPSLKKLVLVNVVYSSKAFTNLISACPVLEELIVKRKEFRLFDGSGTYMVCSLSLKRLTLGLSSVLNDKVVIRASKLEYLNITDDTTTTYLLKEPLSLVEALISYKSRHVDRLLRRLCSAKVLTLTNTTTQALYNYTHADLPMFLNLVKLVISIDCMSPQYVLLLELLNMMPNLEHITFSDGISGNTLFFMPWDALIAPPACLCFKMKEIIIHNGEAVTQGELTFISYLLEHSYKLEKLTINAHDIDLDKQEQLSNFNRGSMCQIELL